MKIIITGVNGYIAKTLKKNLPHSELISLRENIDWKFLGKYDVCIHTAAIVHKKIKNKDEEKLCWEINTKLTINLAEQAKQRGIKHFIFISTMAVFGSDNDVIGINTKPNPTTVYGKTKLVAEQEIMKLQCDTFKVTIIRPPMVYGPSCPGNYKKLKTISNIIPVFPNITNERSVIFIGNLVLCIEQVILKGIIGILHPQDPQYIKTTELVEKIAKANKKKLYCSKLLGMLIKLFLKKTSLYKKVFGSLVYTTNMSTYPNLLYQFYCLEEAILLSEKRSLFKKDETNF